MTLPLPCGHDPLPHEHHRAGSDHWCPVEARWYGPGMPLAVGRHLTTAHGVTAVPPDDGTADHLHDTLHREHVAPLDHAHPCPRCGVDHSEHPEGSAGAELACARAKAAAAGHVGLADQLGAYERDLTGPDWSKLPQTLGEDGTLVRCYGCGTWVERPEVACSECKLGGL